MEKDKRKIIAIYITENEKEDFISFDIEKTEDSDIADYTMKMLLKMVSTFKRDEDKLEVEFKSTISKEI